MTEKQQPAAAAEDVSAGNYGAYGLVQSSEKREDVKFVDIGKIDAKMDGLQVYCPPIKC
jgi:hypothetical protein